MRRRVSRIASPISRPRPWLGLENTAYYVAAFARLGGLGPLVAIRAPSNRSMRATGITERAEPRQA